LSRLGIRKTENSIKKKTDLSCVLKTKKIALSMVNEKEFILFFLEREGLKLTHL
jgi:hypothetical protein